MQPQPRLHPLACIPTPASEFNPYNPPTASPRAALIPLSNAALVASTLPTFSRGARGGDSLPQPLECARSSPLTRASPVADVVAPRRHLDDFVKHANTYTTALRLRRYANGNYAAVTREVTARRKDAERPSRRHSEGKDLGRGRRCVVCKTRTVWCVKMRARASDEKRVSYCGGKARENQRKTYTCVIKK